MPPVVKESRAILVFEGPWGLDEFDQNRSSVLPFVEGIAKCNHNVEVFHTRFYDLNSFKLALQELTKVQFTNTVVYISAHGWKNKIGGVKLATLLAWIGVYSKEVNITGVMLGSCFVGESSDLIGYLLRGTNMVWCAGYSSSSYWLSGSMIDISILHNMLLVDEKAFSDGDKLINEFGDALSHFSRNYIIGEDYKGNKIPLCKSLTISIQPKGQGKKPRDVSSDIWSAWADSQWKK
ncbi:MAG: hypothetical protein ACXW1W_07385 [Methylococcaceae bacterium]